VSAQPIRVQDLDFHFTRDCPRCGRDAGWTGAVNTWKGERVLELACPACDYVFDVFKAPWLRELEADPPVSFKAGRTAATSV
jgi:hypothetical protein